MSIRAVSSPRLGRKARAGAELRAELRLGAESLELLHLWSLLDRQFALTLGRLCDGAKVRSRGVICHLNMSDVQSVRLNDVERA